MNLTLSVFLIACASMCPAWALPGTGQPLTLTRGETHRFANISELKTALADANRAKVPATLLLEDGTYVLDIPALEISCPSLVIRSAGGRRDAVVVRGPDEGPQAKVADVFLVSANDVVLADLTLGYCRYHGVQVRGEEPFNVSGLRVHNCRLVNCNQQFIKGSSSDNDPVGATDGVIEQCLFEFTSGWAYQSYTGGIDIHKGVNWIVRDNLFRNLRTTAGQQGIAEHAVHFWKRCPIYPQNVVVERNWIINCDRGIGFGLSNEAGGFQGGASVIRNNMVFNDGAGPHTDVGIGLEWASDVQVDNNTVQVEKYWAPMEYRFAESTNLSFRNNLVNRAIRSRDGAPPAEASHNVEQTESAWFQNVPSGDLRLASASPATLRQGDPLPKFHEDIDQQLRPSAHWTVGASEPAASAKRLPKSLSIISGPVNGAWLTRNGQAIAFYGDPSGEHSASELVFLTEARRDASWAARAPIEQGTRAVAPAAEAVFLEEPKRFWTELREARFHDYAQKTTRQPTAPLPVSRPVRGGDSVAWQGLEIRVLDGTGYTPGAVSYVVQIDGQKVVFCGDLIRDDGKLQDLFSLQDAIPETRTDGYHGWAARLGPLLASLQQIAQEKPDWLVPLRGPVISDPAAAIARLQERVRALYSNYLSIDALRWYFKDEHIRAKARRILGPDAAVSWMPMAEQAPLPASIIPISNSRLILGSDGTGFLVDCGSRGIIDELNKLRGTGRLRSLEHVFVTHYHDDHTDALPELVKQFGAKVHACGGLIDPLEHPSDYRMPCLTKNPITVTARHTPGDTWRWKEYQLTIYDFPGQTLYHNALLLRHDNGWSALFAGDSFTPSGIDDYCLQNRNFIHEGQGFLRCLDQLQDLPTGCWIINQHVEPAFRFTTAQLLQMQSTLRERIGLLNALLPFDDPNYGLDDNWAHLHPYWLKVRAGDPLHLQMRIMNHSAQDHIFHSAFHGPASFGLTPVGAGRIGKRTEGALPVEGRLPRDCPAGLYVITADVGNEAVELREWTEAVVEVQTQ